MTKMTDGVERIRRERLRQIGEEGFDDRHDDEHIEGELLVAASCYVDIARLQAGAYHWAQGKCPWEPDRWKPSKDPVRNLEKAGALIAAEIDRLERAKEIENAT